MKSIDSIFVICSATCGLVLGWLLSLIIARDGKVKLNRKILCMLSTGFLFALAYFEFRISFELMFVDMFICICILIFFIDFHTQTIPDSLNFALLMLGVASLFFKDLFDVSLAQRGLGLMICGGFFYLLRFFGDVFFKKEILGGGDVKLLFVAGLFLGIKLTFLSIFMASLLATLFIAISILLKKFTKDKYFPFAPFLTISFMMALFWGDKMIDLYLNLLSI